MNGDELRQRREALAMSQAELARRLAVRPATISDWERGARTIILPRVLELALDALARELAESGPTDDDVIGEQRG